MKKTITILFFLICLSGFIFQANSAIRIGETTPSVNAYVIGGQEQLSGQAFQQDALLTYRGYQYTVYYNGTRNVSIGRRKMPVGSWEEVVLAHRNTADDAHNVISMGICANDGTIHLAYDHHNTTLRYCKSIVGLANDPENMEWKASSFGTTTSEMVEGITVPDVTYPRFVNKPDGNLLFECRYKLSGDGDSYLREYDGATHKWSMVGRYVQGMDATPNACAYINRIDYDKNGRLHVTWCWRDDFGGQSNHDLYYGYSDDHGRTWKDKSGTVVASTEAIEPTNDRTTGACMNQSKTSLMIKAIPHNKGYINEESQTSDSRGRVHILSSYMEEGTDSNWASSRTKAILHHHFVDQDGTLRHNFIKSNGNYVKSYCRGQILTDAFDNLYVIAGGAEVYMATPDNNYDNWELLSGEDRGRFISEPQADRPLLMNDGILSFVYLGRDKKLTIIDYLLDNPKTPNGTGLLAEYFSDENYTTLIKSETVTSVSETTLPVGTKSVRWSGTMETSYGEQYMLFLNTSTEANVYVNSRHALMTKQSETAKEYDFGYTLIASHKNNIVIEAKTTPETPISLSWSSSRTPKAEIPATAFYPIKTNGEPGELTPPVLKEKIALDNILMNEKRIINTNSAIDIFNVTPFDPGRSYSLEVKAKVNSITGRGMDIEARDRAGKGFRISLTETTISQTAPLNQATLMSIADNTTDAIYRFAVTDGKVYIYHNKQYIGATDIAEIKLIQPDGTESVSAGIYGNDIIGTWQGSGKPTEYGWSCSSDAIPWNVANGAGGVRFQDAPHTIETGGTFNDRLMTIRWDNGGYSSAPYFYPVTLEANTSYDFSFLYEYWGSASTAQTLTVGISSQKDASGIYDSKSFVTSPTAQVLRNGNFIFTSKEAGQYYITFNGTWAMFGIGQLALKSYTFTPSLTIGKNFVGGSAYFEVAYVSYQDGAFAPDKSGGNAVEQIMNDNNSVTIYSTTNTLIANSNTPILNIRIYDVLGRCCLNKDCHSTTFQTQLKAGLYVVRVNTAEGIIFKKVMIK